MRAELVAQALSLPKGGDNTLPPVHLWNPPLSGDIDIRIATDGCWYHEGSLFTRDALVRLFASILKREGDEHFLVTPVEKWRLRVDCTPFVAVDFDALGAGDELQLVFTTNLGERVHCSAEHPLRMYSPVDGGEPVPCIEVRAGLLARVARAAYYRLVAECGEAQGATLTVTSGGMRFALGELEDDGATVS